MGSPWDRTLVGGRRENCHIKPEYGEVVKAATLARSVGQERSLAVAQTHRCTCGGGAAALREGRPAG